MLGVVCLTRPSDGQHEEANMMATRNLNKPRGARTGIKGRRKNTPQTRGAAKRMGARKSSRGGGTRC